MKKRTISVIGFTFVFKYIKLDFRNKFMFIYSAPSLTKYIAKIKDIHSVSSSDIPPQTSVKMTLVVDV